MKSSSLKSEMKNDRIISEINLNYKLRLNFERKPIDLHNSHFAIFYMVFTSYIILPPKIIFSPSKLYIIKSRFGFNRPSNSTSLYFSLYINMVLLLWTVDTVN